jgi:antitoxin ParD1/3/4
LPPVDFAHFANYVCAMNISLPKEQLEWLEAEVAAGHFSSIDEALTIAVAELKALQEDDLAWAKPYVDEARAEVARGDTIQGDEFLKWLRDRTDSLRQRG